ncbi:MAG: type II toxin-antitoxin system HicA family toxin [Gemmataceae bacterium]
MAKKWKLLKRLLGAAENVRFGDLTSLARAFGFEERRVTGSHHVFSHPQMSELLNIQNYKGKAKAYQVRQFLALLEQYGLDKEDEA